MATPIIPLAESSSTSDYLQESLKLKQAESGTITGKTLSATVSLGSTWNEPKTGVLAMVLPSSSTWHYLYNNSRSEMTEALIAVDADTSTDDATKLQRKQRVGEIVQESFVVSAMSKVYIAIIILVVLFVVRMMYYPESTALVTAMKITAAIGVLAFIYKMGWSEGAGQAYWTEYQQDLSGKLGVGGTLKSALETYEREEAALAKEAADRAAMRSRPRQTSLVTLF